jgi:hypothetical protein
MATIPRNDGDENTPRRIDDRATGIGNSAATPGNGADPDPLPDQNASPPAGLEPPIVEYRVDGPEMTRFIRIVFRNVRPEGDVKLSAFLEHRSRFTRSRPRARRHRGRASRGRSNDPSGDDGPPKPNPVTCPRAPPRRGARSTPHARDFPDGEFSMNRITTTMEGVIQ